MTAWLDPAIEGTSGHICDFLSELKRMIERVRPAALDEARSSASAGDEGAEVELVHAERADWRIWAEAQEDSIVVGVAETHEHFGAEWSGDEDRPFTSEAVDFIAELFRGEVEITTTYRGGVPAAVSHRRTDQPEPLGHTVTVAALMFWRSKRTTVERVSFDARG